ncbi:copper-transporting ATPase PAA1, chloroplastic isoform X2 [Amborella trichopoda]|uniref:copper-transporting ATPase PAA1, chloroplastic isoform X2 n=1 Tax=Amborella trichopoda TaxID=13333 RepID=UPI0009BCCB7D|nr:copper-transporting ATPase PAA1, chloroplastic isoform X2 [Amborella trichopoda]|eukprot:XP_020526220.1 copper-transporting ATPase PAA1, chloroplastic isoform X2 [Amborella trichopoda]
MEALGASAPLLRSCKTLRPLFSRSLNPRFLPSQRRVWFSCLFHGNSATFGLWNSISISGIMAGKLGFRASNVPRTASISGIGVGAGNGGERRGGDGGGGGGGGNGGDEFQVERVRAEEAVKRSDVIILDVGGMSCGGCAASVKRILESQPQVSSASVNLATEIAVVWAIPEVQVTQNWQQHLGEILASHLTSCGFKSNLRSPGQSYNKIFEQRRLERLSRLERSGRELVVSWALCAACLLGHTSHMFGANAASWIHAFHSTGFHMSLSLVTLLGPGRQIILDGIRSLWKGAPNMNTLVGLGAMSSFAVSSIATFIPKLGWRAFFEEPIMLLAFVLLGRNLEQRAKLKAVNDMTGLLSIIPKKARLMVDSNVVEVPCDSLTIGDKVVVLPGDRVPIDGIVTAGRSTVDESSFTGEPLPITKLPGTEVTAGSININGTLTVEVKRPGGETVMGDIVRLVEDAQNREAPVQRLADKVAGRFTYGVMALSTATFLFWNLFGSKLVPAIVQQGSPISLALQLSCSVLVVACPCSLGLATPTAVLVGTSLGATRGLLIRGGDVLEKFALVNTIVFDKTGTLTAGRPVVTKVVTLEQEHLHFSQNRTSCTWSEHEVLRLAAAVESNTNHPIGKAIIEAAQAAGCQYVKATDGTFYEEPGSGAVATVEYKRVAVGTTSWLQRQGVDKGSLPNLEENNQSVVCVGVDGTLAGLVYVEDKIREDANQMVESLSKKGIDVYMLSGDRKQTAEYVATMVGIQKENVLAGVKPDEKKKFIGELQKEKRVVAMVGDGVNDAAALASADVGIAMGGGVGVASEVSTVVLMGNKLSQLLDALELSRLTMKTIEQNLWWAFTYNIVGIPIAAGLLLPVTGTMLTPSIAGALMGLSSLGVMSNSLLLKLKFGLNYKPEYSTSHHKTKSQDDIIIEHKKMEEGYPAKWRNT